MERRAAVIAASVISITAVSASGAMALAGGIFDDPSPPDAPEAIVAEAPDGTPPTTVAPEVVTVFVDEPVAPATSSIAPTTPAPAAAAVPANARPAVFDDHGGDRPERGEHDSDDFDDDSAFDDSDFDERDDEDEDEDEDDD